MPAKRHDADGVGLTSVGGLMSEVFKQREESGPRGAPAWMVTYGDMMGLLLCFFIMLVAMSEIKSEKFKRALESVRSAFGARPETATIVPGDRPARSGSFEERLRTVAPLHGDPKDVGGAETVSLRGNEYLCKTVAEGLMITFGLNAPFKRGAAELSPELKAELADLAEHVRGYTNRIIVRGHCSSDEADLAGTDKWELAFDRARAVADYLMSLGISERRLRMESFANTLPMASNLSPQGRASNRRIEVVVSRDMVAPER